MRVWGAVVLLIHIQEGTWQSGWRGRLRGIKENTHRRSQWQRKTTKSSNRWLRYQNGHIRKHTTQLALSNVGEGSSMDELQSARIWWLLSLRPVPALCLLPFSECFVFLIERCISITAHVFLVQLWDIRTWKSQQLPSGP